MRTIAFAAANLAFCAAYGQTVNQVYNRDTEDPFKLKDVKVESTVVGPYVRTSTLLTYDNPYKKLTEASMNFTLPDAAVLSGFAYYYGDEYVKGQLMDNAKAWFIYTAITSRNQDPGIMNQWTPTEYHCQIFPIKAGADLRVRLYSVSFLQPKDDGLKVPSPDVAMTATYTDRGTKFDIKDWTVRAVHSDPAVKQGADYVLPMPTGPVRAVAQKFKDGRVYVAGIMHVDNAAQAELTFNILRQPHSVQLDPKTVAFMGWLPHKKRIAVRYGDTRVAFMPEMIESGSETARLWAQQMLAYGTWKRGKDVLKFSMKYGVPSVETALLAVPKQQMRLFEAKQKLWQGKAADERRKELAAKRDDRNWSGARNQNWGAGGGGDPEIRVTIPGAKSVQAILPDRRVIDLTPNGDVWGGNFEIPALEPEGTYQVLVVAKMADGSTVERSWSYQVDRTPPKGTFEFQTRSGHPTLVVHSESGLADVSAYAADGTKWKLKEVQPGVYEVELPATAPLKLNIVMKDKASNKGEMACSWQP